MEVIATAKETEKLLKEYAGSQFLLYGTEYKFLKMCRPETTGEK